VDIFKVEIITKAVLNVFIVVVEIIITMVVLNVFIVVVEIIITMVVLNVFTVVDMFFMYL